MKEKLEKKQEFIPALEDIHFIFEELVKGGEYKTIRKLEDEQGLKLWEIKILEEDGHREYMYIRGEDSDTIIYTIFVNKDGLETKGFSVAKYINGEWKLTP